MRKIPRYLYSRQRGAAMFLAVALLALAGLGVALSNGIQTVAINYETQLAAASAPSSTGSDSGDKTGIEKECPLGTIQRVNSIANEEESGVEVSETDTSAEAECVVEWCNEEGTACYIMSAPEVAQIKSSCKKDSGGTCAEKIKQTFKDKIGDKDASAFGENIKNVLTKYDDAFASTLGDAYENKVESIEEAKVRVQGLEDQLGSLIQEGTDTTECGSNASQCADIRGEIDKLKEGIKADESQLQKLSEEAKRLQPYSEKPEHVYREGDEDLKISKPKDTFGSFGVEGGDPFNEDDNLTPENIKEAEKWSVAQKKYENALGKLKSGAYGGKTQTQLLREIDDSLKDLDEGTLRLRLSEAEAGVNKCTSSILCKYFGYKGVPAAMDGRAADAIRGELDEREESRLAGSRGGDPFDENDNLRRGGSSEYQIQGEIEKAKREIESNDYYERGELGVGEQVPSAKPPTEAKCDPSDVDCVSTPGVDYPVTKKETKETPCTTPGCGGGGGGGGPDLGGGLPNLKDLLGPLSKLLENLGGGGKKGGGGGGGGMPQPKPQTAQQQQDKICKEKYPGTSVKDGRCTCPSGQFYTEGKCQARKPKEPTDSKTSELLAELSCAPKEQGIGAPILISYACRGPQGTTLRADGFDAKEKLTGSAEVKADMEKVDPLTKMQKFALTCIKDGKTESKSCEVRVVKSALVLVANPSSVNKGEQGKVGWITAGARNCTVSASQGNSDEVDAFNNAHQNVTQVNGTADTPPLSEDMEIVVKCKMHSGEDKEESVTVKVR